MAHFLDAVRSSNHFTSVFSPSVGGREISLGLGPLEPEPELISSISSSVKQNLNVSAILADFGSSCSSSIETFQASLREIGVTLTEEHIAEIMITVLPDLSATTPTETRPLYSLIMESLDADEKSNHLESSSGWNLDVITFVLSNECHDIDWVLVTRYLDSPAIKISSEASFQNIANFIRRVSGKSFPVAGLMGLWENRVAQFNLLSFVARASTDILDFSSLKFLEYRLDSDIAIPKEPALLCVNFYVTLIELSHSGYAYKVLELLKFALKEYPEYILVIFAQLEDPASGVRAEVLSNLLPNFTGLPGSFPTSLKVMRALFDINRDILVTLCHISLRSASTQQQILDLDVRFKSLGDIGRRVLDEGQVTDMLGYWCVMSEKKGKRVEELLPTALERNPSYSRSVMSFLQTHLPNIHTNMVTDNSSILITYDTAAILIKCIIESPSRIIHLEEIKNLTNILIQQQQEEIGGPATTLLTRLREEYLAGIPDNRAGTNDPSSEFDVSGSGKGIGLGLGGGLQNTGETGDPIADEANAYFQRVYSGEISLSDFITMLKKFKSSSDQREQDVFRSMIHNLFDEYRFFHKYPERELVVSGKLFGSLIQHQLVSSITLGIALRYVLEGLRKDPETGNQSNQNMFRFGKLALEQFRSRLGEWPQYCSHLVQVAHLSRHAPDLLKEAQAAISGPQLSVPGGMSAAAGAAMSAAMTGPMPMPPQHTVVGPSTSIFPQQNQPQISPGHPSFLAAASQSLPQPQFQQQLFQQGGQPQTSMPGSGLLRSVQQAQSVAPLSSAFPPPLSAPSAALSMGGGNNQQLVQHMSNLSLSSNNQTASIWNDSKAGTYSLLSVPSQATQGNFGSGESAPLNAGNSVTSPALATAEAGQSNTPEQPSGPLPFQTTVVGAPSIAKLNRHTLTERLSQVNQDIPNTPLPPDTVRDQVHFIINNVSKSNMETKAVEMRSILLPEYYNWFANYLVVKRISTQPNLHSLYLSLLDMLDSPVLLRAVLNSVYHNLTKLLISSKIAQSSSERSLLRNLAIWLGQITLARNRPILQRRMDLKEMLLWGYENGKLIAVCSFVAKVLEGCNESKVFRPPNPWLISLLSVMRELYELEDLKMNIKFEVQVLCKNIGVRIEDIPRTEILQTCDAPVKDKNPDFNVKVSGTVQPASGTSPGSKATSPPPPTPSTPLVSPSPSMMNSALVSGQVVQGSSGGVLSLASTREEDPSADKPAEQFVSTSMDQVVIPYLGPHVVINANLPLFTRQPNLRKLVPVAIDKAIREIITPVVERSVSIACWSTKQIVLTDFVFEPNEQLLRNAAHLMVSNLAGGLALVTCKEPLRISMANHLRSILQQATNDQAIIEQTTTICCNDNIDLGCMLIEKASTEKAVRDVDEWLAAAIQARKKAREGGPSFVDPNILKNSRFPRELPDIMKPKQGSLQQQHLQVYEAFQRLRASSTAAAAAAAAAGVAVSMPPQQQQMQLQQQLQQQQQVQMLMSPPLPSGMSPVSSGPSVSGAPAIAKQSLPPAAMMHLPSQNTQVGPGINVSLLQQQVQTPQQFSMQQALEAYQLCMARIDAAIKSTTAQQAGRDISLSVLGSDHEIMLYLRDIIVVTQRTQPAQRMEAAMTFAENVFKRILDLSASPATVESLRLETFIGVLEALRDACGGPKKFTPDTINWLTHYHTFNLTEESSRKLFRTILVLLLRAKLVRCADLDGYFVTFMDSGRNMAWVDFALIFVRHCLENGICTTYDFSVTFELVSKLRPANATIRKNLQKHLNDLRLAAKMEEPAKGSSPGPSSGMTPPLSNMTPTPTTVPSMTSQQQQQQQQQIGNPALTRDLASAREHVMNLLERWIRVWTTSNDAVFAQYLQIMHTYGVLKTEEAADKFFRVATDLCVESCIKLSAHGAPPSIDGGGAPPLTLTVVDALSKLFLLLVRLADKEASDVSVRINLLNRILNAVTRSLLDDHENKRIAGINFDQRPYFRLLVNLLQDLGVPDSKQDPNPSLLPLLSAYGQIFIALQPSVVPGFTFSWLQLISHRCFMSHLLLVKGQKGWPIMHRLLVVLLLFLQPYLKTAQLNEAIRRLYKGTLRILLVLLHDFPEFLCDYHLSFCDAISASCVQLRNLVLSAFPRSMRLPDPFTPNLKVDSLIEINQVPRLLTDYVGTLSDSRHNVRSRLDTFLASKLAVDFPTQLPSLIGSNGNYNISLLTAVVVYVGVYAIQNKGPLPGSPSVEFYKILMTQLDAEGRYHMFNSMCNQLRYPNSHTYYFSCALLCLFTESEHEVYQEQITRVLLERLIVHRPHPVSVHVS